jgi:4-oxalocrotonate tautomerase
MPVIRVEWLPGRTLEQKRELTEVLTRELCRIGGCNPEAVNVIFSDVSADNWGHAGKLFADR